MRHLLLFTIAIFTLISCKNKAELQADYNKSKVNDTIVETEKLSKRDSVPDSDPKKLTTAEAIAYASGYEKWEDVMELKFTFNVERGGNTSSRSWKWNTKSEDITMMTAEDTVSYNRNSMDSIAKKADQAFINDRYWLHAPFNLVWDEGTSISETEKVVAPISKDTLSQVTVTYNDSLGYTPGDAYDLYFDGDFMVREWTYRKDNAEKPSMTTTWEDYKNFNGFKFATMHKNAEGNLKLFFTDISVKTETESATR